MKLKASGFTIAALSVAMLSGCANNVKQSDNTSSLNIDSDRIAQLEAEISRLRGNSGVQSLTPPNPKAGECYARVLTPAKFESQTQTIQTLAPSQRIETTKAKYMSATQRVIATEETTRIKVIPASFKTVTETIVVQEASTRLVKVPATFRTVSEKILISPARTEWKKGRGPLERVDSITGEIMCLVEIPAVYKTVSKRVVDQVASIRTVEVPAKTKTITKRVVDQAASTQTVVVPATYKNVRVSKLAQPATQRTIEVPGKTRQVTKRVKVLDSQLEWRSILCETNTNGDVIRRLQRALKAESYNPGPIDGILGRETLSAVNRYQKANNLASGQLTIATLNKLGVAQ